ncbi:MAG: FtsW/RodA/SpoVE family cell cycle protein [Oscillospiraceae bacterium]|nr:FtsW/RodA/SpoVE family cell cycle protein [Oscillospiraceae bacterium]
MDQLIIKLSELFLNAAAASRFYAVMRYAFPLLAFWLLLRCARSLLTFRRQSEIWAWLNVAGQTSIPVTHWENTIGRSKGCDIVIDLGTVSRSHAVLTRYDDGSWSISDIGSRGGVQVGGRDVSLAALSYGQVFTLGGVEFFLERISKEEREEQKARRQRPGAGFRQWFTLLLLTVFQLCSMIAMMFGTQPEHMQQVITGYGALMIAEWVLYIFFLAIRRNGFEVETLAFFLCTLGISVIATASPASMNKELIAIGIGIFLFLSVGWSLRSLERAKRIRYLAAAAGILLLLANLLLGVEKNGARNWIELGGFSFQPSEIVKVCFVFVGASTMDRIVTRRNLTLFIVYTGLIGICLVLISDFGAALIFFVTFVVIAFLRSGNFAGIAMICTAAAFAVLIVVRFRPYVLSRFAAWGNVWEYANVAGGYQQTRSMMCIATAGLFGLGAGNGFMKHVAASDTDLVFALISEEWGLLIGILMILTVLILAVFAVRSVGVARSSFYTIGACAASTVFLMQTALNVFGTVDILPLTGVTFPFVSNGGSSMMASWALLAFIKAADTRQNASFAIRLASGKEERYE